MGEAKWSGEQVSELRQLATQIQGNVAEDSSYHNNTPLLAEVERLGDRINNLTDAIHQLDQHITQPTRSNSQELQSITPSEFVEEDVHKAHQLLALPPPQPDQTLERAEQLKQQLVTLGSCSTGSAQDEDQEFSTVWQTAIEETHGRYQQVLAGLSGDDEQLVAALNSWSQYVSSVESSMEAPAPATRDGLHEEARLCQVHRSILSTQSTVLTTLKEKASAEDAPIKLKHLEGQLHELLLRHKRVLTNVKDKEQVLLSTITTWDTYRMKVTQLQAWLLNLEQEKRALNLRQVPRRRLDKVVSRLQTLLEHIGRGQSQLDGLNSLCLDLIKSCDKSIHPILKAELCSLEQRSANLQAAVNTWLHHLQKSSKLWIRYEDLHNRLSSFMSGLQAGLVKELPTEFQEVQNTILIYSKIITELEALEPDISLLRSTKDDMVESLTPADSRLVNQRMWRVIQLQAELVHQYKLRINTLEDRMELWQLYDTKYNQFMQWAKDMEARIDGSCEQYLESLIRKLEYEYQDEISMKTIQKLWLISEGEELLQCSNKEQAAQVTSKMDIVDNTWTKINEKCRERKQKLVDISKTIASTEITLTQLKEWLYKIEIRLSSPILFQTCSKKQLDSLMEIEDLLRAEINQQSSTISSVLNLCTTIINDCNSFDANGDTDSLTIAFSTLDKRWTDISTQSDERHEFIRKTWDMWQNLWKLHDPLVEWLTAMEAKVGDTSADSALIPYSELSKVTDRSHKLQREIHNHTRQFEEMNQCFRGIARHCGRQNRLDQSNEIKNKVKSANSRFHELNNYITIIMKRIQHSSEIYNDYSIKRDTIIKLLTSYNSRLAAVESNTNQKESNKKKSINAVLNDYKKNKVMIIEFHELIECVFQRSSYPDCSEVESELATYRQESQEFHTRITRLCSLYRIDITELITIITYILPAASLNVYTPSIEPTLLDEASALQTAPAEQDEDDGDNSALSLVPDSELSVLEPSMHSFDATFVGSAVGRSHENEVKAALDEAKKLLLQLEEAITCPTPEGSEVDNVYYKFVSDLNCYFFCFIIFIY